MKRLIGQGSYVALVTLIVLRGTIGAQPQTVDGVFFDEVGNPQLAVQHFGLTSDSDGRVYLGNNSNDSVGIPLQRFDPALYMGTPIAYDSVGPNAGDADGLAFAAGFVFVADRPEGIQKVDVGDGSSTLQVPGVGTNLTGSPFVIRPSNGHFFVGTGTGAAIIQEYSNVGTFVSSFAISEPAETMTIDPSTETIYFANFAVSSTVWSLDPNTGQENQIGTADGTIDGGLAFDPASGLLFLGTANGMNPGIVQTLHPMSGALNDLAMGFVNCTGILRDPVSGDLYFLDSGPLYRLPSMAVFNFLRGDCNGSGTIDVSDPIFDLQFQFLMGPVNCRDAHDSNDDGENDLLDPLYTLAYLFMSGDSPPPPFPACGLDSTDDMLDCESDLCP